MRLPSVTSGPFQYQQVGDRRVRLLAPLQVHILWQVITIPADFEWDGVTLPAGKKLEWIFGHKLSEQTLLASCVHDYWCKEAESYSSWATRLIADSLFLFCLIADRVRITKVVVFFFAVVLFGMAKFLGVKLWRRLLNGKLYNLPPLLNRDGILS